MRKLFEAEKVTWNPLALYICSGDEEYPGCTLVMYIFGWRLSVALPPIIRPWRRKVKASYWSAQEIARMGRDWYWDIYRRQYGFTLNEGHLVLHLGRQTHDSVTEQSWGCFLPWTQWRFVRFSLYDLQGNEFASIPEAKKREDRFARYEQQRKAEKETPKLAFSFKDFDGEEIIATTHLEQREWLFGEGWFKWLSLFRARKVHRSLDIRFSSEVGRRKGSWKGGTIGHSIEVRPHELHESAFRRYCVKEGLSFIGPCPIPPPQRIVVSQEAAA